jgi:hypothetical protein
MAEAGSARLWPAPALVLAVTVTSFTLYNNAPPAAANRLIVPYLGSLVLGPSLVYPWSRWRGAGAGRAALAALLVPFLWLVKEVHRVSEVFSLGEGLYYALNPLALGLFAAAALQMALTELLWRRARLRRWDLVSAPGLTLAAILLLAGSFAMATRGSGARAVFYAYIAVYRRLFGDG